MRACDRHGVAWPRLGWRARGDAPATPRGAARVAFRVSRGTRRQAPHWVANLSAGEGDMQSVFGVLEHWRGWWPHPHSAGVRAGHPVVLAHLRERCRRCVGDAGVGDACSACA